MADTSFRNQFRLYQLKLSHPQRALFTSSSFLSEGNFLIVKLLLFGWTLAFLLASASESVTEPRWQIYLTNWSFVLQAIYYLLGVIVTVKGMFEHQEDIAEKGKGVAYAVNRATTVLHSVQWLFFSTNMVVSIVITFLYYSLLTINNNFISVATHATNSVTTVIDLFIVNIPVHILHFAYVFLYCAIYSLFTVIYWAADGTNGKGKPYVYKVLDWENKPGTAVGYLLGSAFIVGPLVQLLVYGLWRLRLVLAERFVGAPIKIFETTLQGPPDLPLSDSDNV